MKKQTIFYLDVFILLFLVEPKMVKLLHYEEIMSPYKLIINLFIINLFIIKIINKLIKSILIDFILHEKNQYWSQMNTIRNISMYSMNYGRDISI